MTRLTVTGDVRIGPGRPLGPVPWMPLFLLGLLALLAVAPAEAALVYYSKDYSEMGHIWNTTSGICAAAANINSFVYLRNHFPGVYGDTDIIPDSDENGIINYTDQVSARDLMAWGWTSPIGISRPGIYGTYAPGGAGSARAIWEATYWWFNDFAPGTSVLDAQAKVTGTPYWDGGSVIEHTWPRWDFLWDSLVSEWDIELGIRSTTGSIGHALTLTGLAFDDLDGDGLWDDGETPMQIGYLDPNNPVQLTWADVTFGTGDRLEFVWWQNGETFHVYRAYTEGSALVPGDATGDGIVDARDAAVMAANWGLGDAVWAMGDFDGDDVVGPGDATILAANWGYGLGESAAPPPLTPVPEPSVWLLLLGIVPVGLARRSRR